MNGRLPAAEPSSNCTSLVLITEPLTGARVGEFGALSILGKPKGTALRTKPLKDFYLETVHRDVLLLVPGLSKAIKDKLAKADSSFTAAEVGGMTLALAEDLPDGDARGAPRVGSTCWMHLHARE